MPINIESEPVQPLSEIASRLPNRRAGKRTHVSCLWRWVTRGLRGIRLESIRVGGVTCTSMAAVQRFFDALTQEQAVRTGTGIGSVTSSEIRRRQSVSRKVAARLGRDSEKQSPAPTS